MVKKIFAPFLFVFCLYLLWVCLSGIIAEAGGFTWGEFLRREFSGEKETKLYDDTSPPPQKETSDEDF